MTDEPLGLRVRWEDFLNVSGEEIPAYGCVKLTDGEDGVKEADLPDGAPGVYGFNGPQAVADDAYGIFTQDFPAFALFNDSEDDPENGEIWGVVDGSFELSRKLTAWSVSVVGEVDASNHIAQVVALPQDNFHVKISSTTQTDGRYPAHRFNRDANADSLTQAEVCWIDAINDDSLSTTRYYFGKLSGKADDGSFIYDVVEIPYIYRYICIGGYQYEYKEYADRSLHFVGATGVCCECEEIGSGAGCPGCTWFDDPPETICLEITETGVDVCGGDFDVGLTIQFELVSHTTNHAEYTATATINGESTDFSLVVDLPSLGGATCPANFVLTGGPVHCPGGVLQGDFGVYGQVSGVCWDGVSDVDPLATPLEIGITIAGWGSVYTATLTSGDCAGGGGGGGISRSSLGKTSGTGTSLTLSDITVEGPALLIVYVGTVTSGVSPDSAQFAGQPMSNCNSKNYSAVGIRIDQYKLWVATPTTGNLTASLIGGSGDAMLAAVEVLGLANSGVDDAQTRAEGDASTPDTGATGSTSDADEYAGAAFVLKAATTSTWDNGFSSGGQDVSITVGLTTFTMKEGYKILSSTTTVDAALSGSTQDNWVGVVTTFS